MRFQLLLLREHLDHHSHHSAFKQDVKDIRTAELLCERIVGDTYFNDWYNKQLVFGFEKSPTKHYDKAKQDVDYLFKFMSKKIRGWWC